MARSDSKRTKPHINVGTIGHIDHGKNLTHGGDHQGPRPQGEADIAPSDTIDNAPEERARGITIAIAHVEYQTDNRHYAHVDCPGTPTTSRI